MKGEKCFELFSFKAQICLQAFLDFEANTSKFDRLPLPQIFSNNIPNKNIFPSPINISTKKEHFLAFAPKFNITVARFFLCLSPNLFQVLLLYTVLLQMNKLKQFLQFFKIENEKRIL